MGFFALTDFKLISEILGIDPKDLKLYWRDATWENMRGEMQTTKVYAMIAYFGRQSFPEDKELDEWLIDRHFIPQEEREVFLYQNTIKPTLALMIEIYERIKHLELEDNHLEFNWTRHASMYIRINWDAGYDDKITIAMLKRLANDTHFSMERYGSEHDPVGFKWFLRAEF